jgi:hypothetical protein
MCSVTEHIQGYFRKRISPRETLACSCGQHVVTASVPDKVVDRTQYGPASVDGAPEAQIPLVVSAGSSEASPFAFPPMSLAKPKSTTFRSRGAAYSLRYSPRRPV